MLWNIYKAQNPLISALDTDTGDSFCYYGNNNVLD